METASYALVAIDALAHTVVLADGATGDIIAETPYPPECIPTDLVLSAAGDRAYMPVAAHGSGAIFMLNLANTSLYRLPFTIPQPAQFALRAGSGMAFVAGSDGDLYAVDMVAMTVSPWGRSQAPDVACSGLKADGDMVYSVWEQADGGFFAAFDGDGRVMAQLSLDGIPTNIILGSRHVLIPFTGSAGEGLYILDRPSATGGLFVLRTLAITAGGGHKQDGPAVYPSHAAVAADDRTAYVVNEESADITIVDLDMAACTGHIALPRSVSCLYMLPEEDLAIASSHILGDLCRLDLRSGRLLAATACSRDFLVYIAVLPGYFSAIL